MMSIKWLKLEIKNDHIILTYLIHKKFNCEKFESYVKFKIVKKTLLTEIEYIDTH